MVGITNSFILKRKLWVAHWDEPVATRILSPLRFSFPPLRSATSTMCSSTNLPGRERSRLRFLREVPQIFGVVLRHAFFVVHEVADCCLAADREIHTEAKGPDELLQCLSSKLIFHGTVSGPTLPAVAQRPQARRRQRELLLIAAHLRGFRFMLNALDTGCLRPKLQAGSPYKTRPSANSGLRPLLLGFASPHTIPPPPG